MRFLNPKTDFAFKRIFGSAESSDILISFLNAILDLQSPYRIAEVEIVDPYLAPKIKSMKDTYLDRWFYFLKSASSLQAVPKSMAADRAIQHAFSIANKAGLSRAELDDQEHREIFIQDQLGALSLAKKQGIEQGIEQGNHEATLAIARSLLDVLDDNAIADSTGLSIAQVQQLKKDRD